MKGKIDIDAMGFDERSEGNGKERRKDKNGQKLSRLFFVRVVPSLSSLVFFLSARPPLPVSPTFFCPFICCGLLRSCCFSAARFAMARNRQEPAPATLVCVRRQKETTRQNGPTPKSSSDSPPASTIGQARTACFPVGKQGAAEFATTELQWI
jgi:hypothetical protein